MKLIGNKYGCLMFQLVKNAKLIDSEMFHLKLTI